MLRRWRWLGEMRLVAAVAVGLWAVCSLASAQELRKQYWATSLSGGVDKGILKGLYDAVARGEIGWLDMDAKHPIPALVSGINLIFYHVGGNCYEGSDCDRFPSSEPTGDRWGDTERAIDLGDPAARRIVVDDLISLVQKGDALAPAGSIVGVHFDNVHRVSAQAVAAVFNEFLKAVEAAKQDGRISHVRQVGFVAKNNPRAFRQALDEKLLDALPLYQINENASVNQDGVLDSASSRAQKIGRDYCIPVFLKTFGSDVAYTMEEDGNEREVHVSEAMSGEMARLPNISGVAWSSDEGRYHPTVFIQGAPVMRRQPDGTCKGE